jgi:hypothetical protein
MAPPKNLTSVRRLARFTRLSADGWLAVEKIGPLPPINVKQLMSVDSTPFALPPDTNVVSTDVMSIAGSAATPIQKDAYVLYDTEIVAIIQRVKSKASGLVVTKVWGWSGKNAKIGDREDKKLHELAKRYGTALIPVKQYFEPADLVHAVGGKLAVRQVACNCLTRE